MKKRYFKKRDKCLPKGYDSKLELRLHETCLQDAQHHPPKEDLIPYSVPHTYEYDFMFELGDTLYICETKGRARDQTELRKYSYVKQHMKDWNVFFDSDCDYIELFFIFENAATPMPFAKKRKDGSKQSHGEWATKNGFRWLCEKRGDLENILTKQDLIGKLNSVNSKGELYGVN